MLKSLPKIFSKNKKNFLDSKEYNNLRIDLQSFFVEHDISKNKRKHIISAINSLTDVNDELENPSDIIKQVTVLLESIELEEYEKLVCMKLVEESVSKVTPRVTNEELSDAFNLISEIENISKDVKAHILNTLIQTQDQYISKEEYFHHATDGYKKLFNLYDTNWDSANLNLLKKLSFQLNPVNNTVELHSESINTCFTSILLEKSSLSESTNFIDSTIYKVPYKEEIRHMLNQMPWNTIEQKWLNFWKILWAKSNIIIVRNDNIISNHFDLSKNNTTITDYQGDTVWIRIKSQRWKKKASLAGFL